MPIVVPSCSCFNTSCVVTKELVNLVNRIVNIGRSECKRVSDVHVARSFCLLKLNRIGLIVLDSCNFILPTRSELYGCVFFFVENHRLSVTNFRNGANISPSLRYGRCHYGLANDEVHITVGVRIYRVAYDGVAFRLLVVVREGGRFSHLVHSAALVD